MPRSFRSDAARRLAAIVLVAVVGLLSAGCRKSGPRRYQMSGTVTYGGQPVRMGRIVFQPDGTKGNSGPQGFAPIEEGRYDTSSPGCRGSVGGPMLVIIDGMDVGQGEDIAASGRLLFPRHEETIDLPLSDTTHDFVVPKAAKP